MITTISRARLYSALLALHGKKLSHHSRLYSCNIPLALDWQLCFSSASECQWQHWFILVLSIQYVVATLLDPAQPGEILFPLVPHSKFWS